MTLPRDHKSEIQEAAEYWDTHSVTEDNTEPVTGQIIVKRPLTSVFSIRLHHDDVTKLRAIARANGIGPTTMARKLLLRSINEAHLAVDDSKLITISAADLDSAFHSLVESIVERSAHGESSEPLPGTR